MEYLVFDNIVAACAIGLIGIGLAGLLATRNLFRMVLALALAEAGGNLFLVLAGWRPEAVAPILGVHAPGTAMVDPIPQSLVLTSIVIGVGVQALAVAAILRIHRRYGTLDMRELRERFEMEVCDAAEITPPGSRGTPAGKRPLPPPIPEPELPAPGPTMRRSAT
jgi:multisubunit Na+/H+ antiporter MnhC subunit